MSEDPASIDHMDYAGLTQNALRGVIRQALLKAALPHGLPGEHHFYITFLTKAEGVSIPADVLMRYPNDMTIVLQHQYRELKVFEDSFNVTLSFGGTPKVLRIPFGAITRFYDPAVQFVLEFEIEDGPEFDEDISDAETPADTVTSIPSSTHKLDIIAEPADPTEGDDRPKVVSLEQFRKK